MVCRILSDIHLLSLYPVPIAESGLSRGISGAGKGPLYSVDVKYKLRISAKPEQHRTSENSDRADEDEARESPLLRSEAEIREILDAANVTFKGCDGDVEVDTPCCKYK